MPKEELLSPQGYSSALRPLRGLSPLDSATYELSFFAGPSASPGASLPRVEPGCRVCCVLSRAVESLGRMPEPLVWLSLRSTARAPDTPKLAVYPVGLDMSRISSLPRGSPAGVWSEAEPISASIRAVLLLACFMKVNCWACSFAARDAFVGPIVLARKRRGPSSATSSRPCFATGGEIGLLPAKLTVLRIIFVPLRARGIVLAATGPTCLVLSVRLSAPAKGHFFFVGEPLRT